MRDRVHYGWLIVAVCMMMIFGASLVSTGMSIGINALHRDYGMTGAETSAIITVCSAVAFISTCFADRFYKRLGLRNGMFVAVTSGCVAFLIYTMAGGVEYVYYIGSVFGGVTYGLGFMLPASILMRRWFTKNRALALSLCSSGSGLSIAIGSPLLEMIIDNIDLSTSFLVEAVFMAVTAILILLFIKNDPSEMGMEPLGGKAMASDTKKEKRFHLTHRALIMLMVAATFAGICGFPATSHFALNFTTSGLDDMTVALGISFFGFVLLVSKLMFGESVDRKGTLFSTTFFGLFIVAGLFGSFMVSNISENWLMFTSLALMGIGYPIISLGYPNWTADFTSVDDYTVNLKRLQVGYQFGIMAGSFFPGLIFDASGSYSWAYLMFSLLMVTSLILVWMTYASAKDAGCPN